VSERLRVLVVDDSAFMRGAITRVLGADGRFEVVGQASDGAEGVKLALALTPDVVTMDFNMPGMNGAEATRQILASRADIGAMRCQLVMQVGAGRVGADSEMRQSHERI